MSDQQPTPEQRSADLQEHTRTVEAPPQTREQQATTLFSEAPGPYLLLTAEGRLQDVNAAGCALLGRTREGLLGKRLEQFLTPASQGSFTVLLRQALESGFRQRGEAGLLQPDGPPLDVLLDLHAARFDGALQHFRLLVTDVTAYKQAHRRLLDASVSHEAQLQEQEARVRALNQELEQIVTTFNQQLHLPVTRALDLLGLARRALAEPPEELTQPLQSAEQAVGQIRALLATLDRYMRLRGMRLRVRPVDLNGVLREVLRNARPMMVDRNVQITHDPLPTVRGDRQALYIILDEYLGNALKYTKERAAARIHVRVQDTESAYLIGVQDNGVGFNLRQRDKLFQLFGRLHSSRVYEGTGVGLMTVRRVCERFGGRVWAEGKVGHGATFWFAWPKEPRLRE